MIGYVHMLVLSLLTHSVRDATWALHSLALRRLLATGRRKASLHVAWIGYIFPGHICVLLNPYSPTLPRLGPLSGWVRELAE
jgi:hypothetical protein